MTDRIKLILDDTLSGRAYVEPVHIEYDRMDTFLSEHERNGKRIYEYVTSQEPYIREYSAFTGLFNFDGSVPGDAMSMLGAKNFYGKGGLMDLFYNKPIDRLATFEWQHATADYNAIIRKGIKGLIAEIEASKKVHVDDEEKIEYLNALKKVAEAMIVWAHKCSDKSLEMAQKTENEEYKKNLLLLSESLKKVPENEATSFYEAVLSIYVLFSYDPDSLGTLDRTLQSFYDADINSGKLTRAKAKEYLQELFLMLQARTHYKSDRFTKGGESHFCVGGYNKNHEDVFSDLSLLIFEAITSMPTYIPQITLRRTKKLPFETFKKILDFERNDPHKRIAFVNDEAKLDGCKNVSHFPFEVACRYTTLGCNETAYPGGFVGGTTNSNGLRSMDNTFFERTDEVLAAKTFDEFFEIYKSELFRDFDEMMDYGDKFNLERAKNTNYVSSLFFDGCIEKALPLSKGPIKYASAGTGVVGVPNIFDSLAIVKQFVYDEKIITMETLVDALHKNWEGYEDLNAQIKKIGKFFGNDDETSNYVASLWTETAYHYLQTKRSCFGYPIGIGNLQGYNHHHQYFGALTRATPDGRYNGEMLKFGLGQSGGYDRNGLTALLASVAKCDKYHLMSGSNVTNIYLEESLIKDDENFEKTARLLDAYFDMGGTHFQLNYLSKADLIEAKTDPEKHKNLRVRVSGFSDYFTRLSESIQDDVIKRTEHNG